MVKFANDEVAKIKKEIELMANKVNRKMARLEKNNLTDTPTYQKFLEITDGKTRNGKFSKSVSGKSYNELQQQLARMKQIDNAKTSTVRGVKQVLKDLASVTKMKYKSVHEIYAKSKNFFQLASKIEQYLRNVNNIGSAISYQQIWTAINKYVEQQKIDLKDSDIDIDNLTEKVSELLDYEKLDLGYSEGYKSGGTWFYVKE